MIDRRRYPRIPVHYDLAYKKTNGKMDSIKRALVQNVSRVGMKIKYSDDLRKDDMLRLDVYKTVDSEPITCFGRVVWHQESPLIYGEKEAGICFTRIGWSDTGTLVET